MAARKKPTAAPAGSTPIEAVSHQDSRKHIPTREQSELVADEEQATEPLLYPRDTSLDPQLVWKGKDQQDREGLRVPVVPIYIQEKIQPKALIEDLRSQASGRQPQLDLFADFAASDDTKDKQLDFYQHDDRWTNRMILGDSMVVMTSLAQKEGLRGKVQMIYMDPPYGIKFGSNWQVSTRKREVKDGKVEDLVRQPEQIKAFRDTWELGIHSYLAYLRDRLQVARELLTESGSVFVQISDENSHLVRSLLDEIFGAGNLCAQIPFVKTSSATGEMLGGVVDHLLWYARNREAAKFRPLYRVKEIGGDGSGEYVWLELEDGLRRRMTSEEVDGSQRIPPGSRAFRLGDLTSQSVGREKGEGAACWFPVPIEGRQIFPNERVRWKTNQDGMRRLVLANRVFARSGSLGYVRMMDDFSAFAITNLWTDTGIAGRPEDKIYVVQTSPKVVQRALLMTTDPGDLVLDPTCGSGTTAYVAEQWGRRWITSDTSRVAVALARQRLVAAKYPYYTLADSAEGQILAADPASDTTERARTNDVRRGFACKRIPHIMLSTIAHDEEIDPLHARFETQLVPLREKLNALLKKTWQEWEVPRDPAVSWPTEAKAAHTEFWQLRRARQKEINASIARRAESETLYDQPYEDPKRIRVSGPFTVESLSPHRVLSADQAAKKATAPEEREADFVTTILENLKKAGVQNTVKNERLQLDRVSSFAGAWIQGEGWYFDKEGKERRVALSIGPEHGTVGPEQVKGAVKEATGHFDLLVVCGFAFDALTSDVAKDLAPASTRAGSKGALTLLLSRMNPDLAMGDDLLKKTGAGNLFMVFGEPDIELRKLEDGRLEVEIKGLDVYDPTTGQIRSHSTDDIACWFLDTDYNGESFFVRHAYFTGANDPYEKLKRALKAEIDEQAWASLYRTTSRPFDAPRGGLIAVKVINHYGDEVLKVYEAPGDA